MLLSQQGEGGLGQGMEYAWARERWVLPLLSTERLHFPRRRQGEGGLSPPCVTPARSWLSVASCLLCEGEEGELQGTALDTPSGPQAPGDSPEGPRPDLHLPR